MDFYTFLVYARRKPLIGKLAYFLLKLLGAEIPRSVPVGPGFELAHGGFGVVIHSRSRIGSRVKVYPGVTLGRADIYRPASESRFEGIVIEDDAVDFLINGMLTHHVRLDEVYKKLVSDLELGLKLVREKTGKRRFFLTREALEHPNEFLDRLVREELKSVP